MLDRVGVNEIEIPKDKLLEICNKYKVSKLEFFGSVLRNDFSIHSDIDILVEFNHDAKIGYTKFYNLQEELSNIFKRKVDLVPKAGLKQKQKRMIFMYKTEKPMKHDTDRLYLLEIIESADAISRFISGLNKDDFFNDDLRQSAVHQKLITIGVAASRISIRDQGVDWNTISKWGLSYKNPPYNIFNLTFFLI